VNWWPPHLKREKKEKNMAAITKITWWPLGFQPIKNKKMNQWPLGFLK
jgi:hypothetical protein